MKCLSLNIDAISKGKLRNIRGNGLFFSLVSLLFVSVLFFSSVDSTFNGFSIFVSGVEPVKVGTQDALRNAINTAVGSTVIALTADITLTGSALNISAGNEITLISDKPDGFWKLIGADNQVTISVDGILTLDGIIVTHMSGATGRGVMVTSCGTLFMSGGEISGNDFCDDFSGGGVYVTSSGFFVMSGGTISDNSAGFYGGGVYNAGFFVMSGGTITHNIAGDYGGGVCNWDGFFVMSGGTISDNSAVDGGGVHMLYSDFVMSGGTISNNAADHWGGGVCMTYSDFVMSGGTISDNVAGRTGGGVFNIGNFTMSGGKISKNTVLYVTESGSKDDIKGDISAGAGVGGGVSLFDGVFDLRGGIVYGNKAPNSDGNVHKHGGDVYYFGVRDNVVAICMGITFVVVAFVVVGVIVLLLRRRSRISIILL